MGDMGDYWRDVKAAKKENTKDVLRVTQSPMNAKRWALELSCGHDAWVTRGSRPQLQRMYCDKCASATPSTCVKR